METYTNFKLSTKLSEEIELQNETVCSSLELQLGVVFSEEHDSNTDC
jgi:hypothetical protein